MEQKPAYNTQQKKRTQEGQGKEGESYFDKTQSCVKAKKMKHVRYSIEEKSLKNLLCLAQREMKEEAMKISVVRGYAANNSRALLRRRSSMTEYVRMSTRTYREAFAKTTEEKLLKCGGAPRPGLPNTCSELSESGSRD